MEGENKDYITLFQATKLCSYSEPYLRLRARQGKLKSIKLGKKWMTSAQWISEYIEKTKQWNEKIAAKKAMAANDIQLAAVGSDAGPEIIQPPIGTAETVAVAIQAAEQNPAQNDAPAGGDNIPVAEEPAVKAEFAQAPASEGLTEEHPSNSGQEENTPVFLEQAFRKIPTPSNIPFQEDIPSLAANQPVKREGQKRFQSPDYAFILASGAIFALLIFFGVAIDQTFFDASGNPDLSMGRASLNGNRVADKQENRLPADFLQDDLSDSGVSVGGEIKPEDSLLKRLVLRTAEAINNFKFPW